MSTITTELLAPDPAGLARAAALLRAGALVAFGTETVYGLGADATNERAVAAIFAAKGRPHFNPLIAHFASAEAALAQVVANDAARQLGKEFWPGPLTLVLPRQPDCTVALLAGAGLDTLAVRVPAHPIALSLLRAVDRPIAAPSANRSGQVSPTTARHVLDGLGGRIAAVLDCGPCAVGVESTVLDLSGKRAVLLRPGGVTAEAIEALIGPIGRHVHGPARSPGMLASHYAPDLPVRMNATTVAPDEALLAFGPPLLGASVVFDLSPSGDLTEAAARLFTGLRTLDAQGKRLGLIRIAAMEVPGTGLGLAINDRLERAAAPKEGQGSALDPPGNSFPGPI
jgi:L-threonylcarbamoyladenylate synthase